MASKLSGSTDDSKGNLDQLVSAGVIREPERLMDAEREAIESLGAEEVKALTTAFRKIAKVALRGKNGDWRGICF